MTSRRTSSWGGPRTRWLPEEDALLMAAVEELGYGIEAARLARSRGLDRSEVACDIRLKSLRSVRGEHAPLSTKNFGGNDLLLRALVKVHGSRRL